MEQNHHYGWMVTVLIIVGVCVYIWSANKPNVDNYGKDSTHNEQHRSDWPFSIHVGEGSCAHFSKENILGKPNAKTDPIVNSVKR